MQCNFHGKRVLIVEDDLFAAAEIAFALEAANAVVLGPFADLQEADLQVLHSELAILDIHIGGRTAFALADRLSLLDVPYIFFTGHDRSMVPPRFSGVDYIPKPTSPLVVVQQLEVRAREASPPRVVDLVPMLREQARAYLSDPLAADRLVERTLQLAIDDKAPLPSGAILGAWLLSLMERAIDGGSAQFLI